MEHSRYYHLKNTNRFLRWNFVTIVLMSLMFASAPARATSVTYIAPSVTYFLDQSNALPDGTNYLSIYLNENETGGVDFLVQTLDPLNDLAGRKFGIQKFGFSFNDDTKVDIEFLPNGWSVRHDKRMGEFGNFDIRLQGNGRSRTNQLGFTVDGATLGDFADLFSAHVAGFEWCQQVDVNTVSAKSAKLSEKRNCTTSAYFAGSLQVTPVPLPAAVWLFGTGLLGLAGAAYRRRR